MQHQLTLFHEHYYSASELADQKLRKPDLRRGLMKNLILESLPFRLEQRSKLKPEELLAAYTYLRIPEMVIQTVYRLKLN